MPGPAQAPSKTQQRPGQPPGRTSPLPSGKLPATPIEITCRWLLKLTSFATFAFLVVPILIVVAESFNGVNYLSFPLEGFSTMHYSDFINDQSWVSASMTSARIAALASLVATLLGTMAAWALARAKGRGSSMAYGLLYSPVVVPIIVLAISYYNFFSDLQAVGNWIAVALAYAVMGVPFVLVAVSSALHNFDPEIENAARTLGAGPIRTLWHITFPRIASGIAAGAIFAFVVAFDEAVIILFVSGSGSITLSRKLWDSVRYDLSPSLAVAGTVLIGVCVMLFLLSELITSLRERKAKQ
jgi:putative spermidine/putrescine transport system permease protein